MSSHSLVKDVFGCVLHAPLYSGRRIWTGGAHSARGIETLDEMPAGKDPDPEDSADNST